MSRDLFLLSASRIAQILLSLISVRIVTSLLSVEQYGVLALLLAFNGFFGLFLLNPVGVHIQRHTHQWVTEGSLLSRLGRFNVYIIVVSALAVALVAIWSSVRTGENMRIAWLMALVMGWYVYVLTCNTTFVSILGMIGFRGAQASLAVLTSFLALAGSVALSISASSGVLWLAGQALGYSVIAILAHRILQRRIRPMTRETKDTSLLSWETIKSFCFPLAIATGFMFALTSGYRFVVEWGWGVRALGLMAVGFGVSSQMWSVCETLLMQFLFPHFYKAISGNNKIEQQQAYSNLLNAVVPIYILLLGVTLASGGWAVAVLTDVKFHDAYKFAMFGAAIEWCRAMASLLSQAAQVTKRTVNVIAPYAVAGSLAIGGSLVAGWFHAPLTVVAMVLVAAGIVLLLLMVFQMSRLLHVDVKWQGVVTMGSFACLIIGTATVIGFKSRAFIESVLSLTAVGLLAGIAMFIYLRQNNAYDALLSVQLNPIIEAQPQDDSLPTTL